MAFSQDNIPVNVNTPTVIVHKALFTSSFCVFRTKRWFNAEGTTSRFFRRAPRSVSCLFGLRPSLIPSRSLSLSDYFVIPFSFLVPQRAIFLFLPAQFSCLTPCKLPPRWLVPSHSWLWLASFPWCMPWGLNLCKLYTTWRLHFRSEDGGIIFLWNIGVDLQVYATLQPRSALQHFMSCAAVCVSSSIEIRLM
jgi:hypothetical protein